MYLEYGQINIQNSTFAKTKTDSGESNCFLSCKNHKQLKLVLLILLADVHKKSPVLLYILQVRKDGTVQNRNPVSVLAIKKMFPIALQEKFTIFFLPKLPRTPEAEK